MVPPFGLLGRLRQRCGRNPPLSKLEEVVGDANHRPFGAYFFEAAQQELAETAGLFDLPEHRLGQLPALIFARMASTRVGAAADLGSACDLGSASGRDADAGSGAPGASSSPPLTLPATASLARPVAT